eukprot:scaffold30254_cov107-Isochrysis_galbana.AAC.6
MADIRRAHEEELRTLRRAVEAGRHTPATHHDAPSSAVTDESAPTEDELDVGEILSPPPMRSEPLFPISSFEMSMPETAVLACALPDSEAAPSAAALGEEEGALPPPPMLIDPLFLSSGEDDHGEILSAEPPVFAGALLDSEAAPSAAALGEEEGAEAADEAARVEREREDERSERAFEEQQLRELQEELELLNRGPEESGAHPHAQLEAGEAAAELPAGQPAQLGGYG